ncbi:MAG: ribulose-phosphate 3-epimerase [Candidatus Marinimicrobia bacterium]|nr:ribulose-phosphate 3-epimerase [Candidatus Neomarinimicrobiota bacterium]
MSLLTAPQIAPSVLAADFSRLGAEVQSVQDAGGKILHLDVMDGHYVPNLSFGPLVVKALRETSNMLLEAHLMISYPDKYIESFIRAGADIILVHPSTCPSTRDTLRSIHSLGVKAGLVINPDENISLIDPYLDEMDQLLIMSVFPGFGGQKFIPSVLSQIPLYLPRLAENGILLEIDGGINLETIGSLKDMGIDRFVAGSAVFNKTYTPGENYLKLLSQIS